MAKRKKLSCREVRELKKAREYSAICTALRLKATAKKFGYQKMLWAMKRFIRLQGDLSQLTQQKKKLESEMAKIGEEEKRIATII